jgi:hypothetical protein
MPAGIEDTGGAASGRLPDAETGGPSRRSMLRGAAGAGAAGLAATMLGGAAFPAAASASTAARGRGGDHAADDAGEAVVVHVRNAATGEIDVFRGTSHTRLHDRGLAAQLIRASK